ncbi:hypothetical protein T265_08305 [Opisthorchis viverrini]|uniref:Uncharacterized protein n=1 Tax=Opisthorchis viverrini TaxID=6198 RepID=A0A074ZE66_OPIVI|nr:hypothetical protein T265_08305 [Opisthorchis viverrini]KER23947.1 hypothetical protein T265_08305 [Opisthorchis viverrini]
MLSRFVFPLDPGTGEPGETAKESLNLNVLPFASPIATQLQSSPSNQINGDLKPTTVLVGILQLELPNDRTVRIPVSVKADELKRCLASLGTSVNTLLASNQERMGDAKNETVPTSPQKSESDAYHHSQESALKVAKDQQIFVPKSLPCSASSPLTDSVAISTRTQEELQAARIILSLANSGAVPLDHQQRQHEQDKPQSSELGETISVEHCDDAPSSVLSSITQGQQQNVHAPITFSRSCSQSGCNNGMGKTVDSDPSNLVAFSTGPFNASRPRWPNESPTTAPRSSLSRSADPLTCQQQKQQSEIKPHSDPKTPHTQEIPNQTTSPTSPMGSIKYRKQHGTIRPPPKKRLSVHYQRTPSVASPVVVVSGRCRYRAT